MGFQDKVQKLFAAIGQKQVTLNIVWRAYLAIAETAMKVGFKVCQTVQKRLGFAQTRLRYCTEEIEVGCSLYQSPKCLCLIQMELCPSGSNCTFV